jgi:hypothetical protein
VTQRTWNFITATFVLLLLAFLVLLMVFTAAFQDQYEDDALRRTPSRESVRRVASM